MTPQQALVGVKRAFLDSAPVIYLIENDDVFGSVVGELVKLAVEQSIELVASPITLAECLAGAQSKAAKSRFIDFLTGTREVQICKIDQFDAVLASEMRREQRLPLPDCLQIATAVNSVCDVMFTNDLVVGRFSESIRVVCISELESSQWGI